MKTTKKYSKEEKQGFREVSENRIKESIQKVLESFKNQSFVNQVSLSYIQKQITDKPSNYWSIGNRFLMYLHGTSDARGFQQWQKVERTVRKGAKAIHILAPVYKKIRVKDKEVDENGNEVEIEDEISVIAYFKTIPVFRVEDTTGKEIVYPEYKPENPPKLIDIAQKMGIEVNWEGGDNQEYGYYVLGHNKIVLKSYDEKVFYHELAHAIHDKYLENLQGGQIARQEIIAEMTAAAICELFGVESYLQRSYEYISHYADSNSPTKTIAEIMRILDKVEKIINIIFGNEKPTPPKKPEKTKNEKVGANAPTSVITTYKLYGNVKKAIQTIQSARSKDITRLGLTGICFDFSSQEYCKLYATDGNRLHITAIPYTGKKGFNGYIIIPYDMAKKMGKEVTITIEKENNDIFYAVDNGKKEKMEWEYPNVKDIIKDMKNRKSQLITIDVKDLKNGIKMVDIFKNHNHAIHIKDNILFAVDEKDNNNTARYELDKSLDCEFNINAQYLYDYLKHTKKAMMYFTSSEEPIYFVGDYQSVIMPIQVRNEE